MLRHQPWSRPGDESRHWGGRKETRAAEDQSPSDGRGPLWRVPPGRGWDPEHTRDSLAFRFPQLPLPAVLHLCSCWHPPLWDIQAGDTMVGANLKARGSKTPGSANPHTAWGSPERQRNKCRIIRSKVTLHCD